MTHCLLEVGPNQSWDLGSEGTTLQLKWHLRSTERSTAHEKKCSGARCEPWGQGEQEYDSGGFQHKENVKNRDFRFLTPYGDPVYQNSTPKTVVDRESSKNHRNIKKS